MIHCICQRTVIFLPGFLKVIAPPKTLNLTCPAVWSVQLCLLTAEPKLKAAQVKQSSGDASPGHLVPGSFPSLLLKTATQTRQKEIGEGRWLEPPP